MGGGSSKSESQQNTTSESINSNISDNSGTAFGSIKATSVEVLDGGAIEDSFAFAKETQANFGQTFESVLGLVEKSIDAQGEILGAQAQANVNENTGGMSNIMPLIAFAAISGFVAIKVLK